EHGATYTAVQRALYGSDDGAPGQGRAQAG
ncbi:hypothetical protein GA0115253_101641, partial [Streptomyces sp. Termitarium-T10T-6]